MSALRHALRPLIPAVNALAAPVERVVLAWSAPVEPAYPPIFIVGPPRSGTTLLLQLLVSTLRVGYVTNVMEWMYRAPYVVGQLTNRFLKLHDGAGFRSDYGKSRGLGAPNQGTRVLGRWFAGPNGGRLLGGPGGPAADEMRRVFAALTRLWDSPLLVKDLRNAPRIGDLAAVFPTSVFIEIRREPLYNAVSILKGRVEVHGSKEAWISIGPSTMERLRARPYWEQVVEQVLGIEEDIRCARQALGEQRFMTVDYAVVCRDPAWELGRVRAFLDRHGCAPEVIAPAPPPFRESRPRNIDPDDFARIEAYVRERCAERVQASPPAV